jgi:hypothetical protein
MIIFIVDFLLTKFLLYMVLFQLAMNGEINLMEKELSRLTYPILASAGVFIVEILVSIFAGVTDSVRISVICLKYFMIFFEIVTLAGSFIFFIYYTINAIVNGNSDAINGGLQILGGSLFAGIIVAAFIKN